MIISPTYGPQLDPSDGSCGDVKLVKRYVLVSGEEGQIWTARQGRHTQGSEAEALRVIADIRKSNHPDSYPADLRPAPWWCWPVHFDPACRYPEEEPQLPS